MTILKELGVVPALIVPMFISASSVDGEDEHPKGPAMLIETILWLALMLLWQRASCV